MMRSIIFACLLLVTLASAKATFTELQYRNQFTNWMIQHGRQYSNADFKERYQIFKNNMDFVSEWNAQGSQTILGLNIFADITNAEYRKLYLKNAFDASSLLRSNDFESHNGRLAASVNWVAKGAVTGIKNQGECGGCWSFSATGAVEGVHEIATGDLVSLSEQQLIDCSDAYGNQGCDGGLMSFAFQYIINNKGIDTEASYPFTGEQGKCHFNPNTVGATISSYVNVTSLSETALAVAVNLNPVSVAIDASHPSFQLYSTGIYYEPKCSQTNLDHAVLAVGYGSNGLPGSSADFGSSSENWGPSSTENSQSWGSSSENWGSSSENWGSSSNDNSESSENSESWTGSSYSNGGSQTSNWSTSSPSGLIEASSGDNSAYWIVKNSWGTSWGVSGFIYMSKDRNNNCGISTLASYPVSSESSSSN